MNETVKEYKGYLIDLDGTMYKGDEPIAEAPAFIERLRSAGKQFLFVTNNSTSSPEDVAIKLKNQFDIEAHENEIYTSSLATADYLKTLGGNSVYVVGEKGLQQALEQAGFVVDEDQPDHVVVGLDRLLTYEKCEKATLAIQKGANFVATNKDTNLPTERGMVPGAGSLVALIEKATRVTPTFVGKPESIIMDEALKRIGLAKSEVLMVGDNYETDILAGINNAIDTLLVYTGFTKEVDLANVKKQPTYTIQTLDEWDITK
ncbi:TIGR01457 family HAD-type hydrolase [Marinilactibacillus sp. Marseille-P9653]|uniref:TIGR01457 family HAD-type hydrolase n=1 Tax=Marinilactibacillus sp. Marseille-P9653 TaxID=2866583 RepID=UPI001CE3B8DC|nr:TIGR01457 family HAD-type hydrolase [Marinilactibacillus sp. Marseille-P9653]